MEINKLKPRSGSLKSKKRVGRGDSSGHGNTAGRGTKGQRSRSGAKISAYFEGGQMPLSRRVPKRGFRSVFRKEYTIINVEQLNRFNDGETVTPERLIEDGVIKKISNGLKILSKGQINKKITVKAHKFSKEALNKIESAGGKVEVI